MVYREFFPRGLTALDEINEDTLGPRPTLSHVTARDEVKSLIDALKLPIDERGKRRTAARAEWSLRPKSRSKPTICSPIDGRSSSHCARRRTTPLYGVVSSGLPQRPLDEQ